VDNTVFDDVGSTALLDSVFSVEVKMGDDVYPVIVGVELQNKPSPAHALYTRMQYYAAKMLGRQVWKDTYDDLRQVYSVWILPDPLVRDRGKVRMLSVQPNTPDDEVDMTSMLNMVMVNLGVEVPESEDILDFLTPFFNKESKAQTEIGFDHFRQRYKLSKSDVSLEEVRELCSLFADSKERYTREGIEIGIDEGKELKTIEAVTNLVLDGKFGIDEAMKYFNIPSDRYDSVKERIVENISRSDARLTIGSGR
jgi:hypothetical protein